MCVVPRGLAPLAGRVDRVAAAAVPGHGHVTVVREAGDALAAHHSEEGANSSDRTAGAALFCFLRRLRPLLVRSGCSHR